MIEFPQLATLSIEPPFTDDVLRGVYAPPDKADEPGRIWIDLDGELECLRFYGRMVETPTAPPLIFMEGDVLERAGHLDPNWTVPSSYLQGSPLLMQAEAEQFAIALGRTFVNLARPGTYGSSGHHLQRRREREVKLVDAALDRLKTTFNWTSIDLAGLSGGGHLVGALMARRSDIRCAVIASGNVAVRKRNQERGMTADATGYDDFVDPIDLVSEVAAHPPKKIIVLTDPQDMLVSAAVQSAYVEALRNVGVAVDHRFVPALDPRHHILRLPAMLAAATSPLTMPPRQ
jgi:dienelactone hydrolase